MKRILIVGLLVLTCRDGISAGVEEKTVSGSGCGPRTGTAMAVDFTYVTPANTGKYLTLSATSEAVTYNLHSYLDAPDIQWSTRYKPYKYGDGGGAIQQWFIQDIPAHGILYEGSMPLYQGSSVQDPDDLFYVPETGFLGQDRFSYCVLDATGQSNIAEVTVRVAPPEQYPMPLGISAPGFGINEQPPADPPEWPTQPSSGFFYIDADDPACTDNNNDYGYPDQPRCSFPSSGSSIAAGGKVVLRAASQPYALRNSSWHLIDSAGTAGNPAWLVGDDTGPNKPVIVRNPARSSTALRVTGGYIRLSGLVFDGVTLSHRGGGANEVVVRHSEFKNNPATGGGGTTVGLSTEGSGVLVFNVYAHDNGVVEADGLSVERDIHAFVGSSQSGFWILDSRCDENAGDCVQLTNNNTTSDVFVGRLVAHSEGENCLDIKDFNRVVVSESSCWDLRQVQYGNSGGNSQNFYVNDEGVQQNYVYFINNRSWDTGGANFAASNIGGRVYFIGNVSFASPAGNGFYSGGGAGSRHVYLNTFSDSETGIYHFGSGSAQDRYIVGNVVNGATLYQLRVASVASVINLLDYNLFTQVGDFATGSASTPTVHNGLSNFIAASGLNANGMESVNAGFYNEDAADYRLTSLSELVDVVPTSVIQPLLADLASDLGITLVDAAGTSRPSGVALDAGAFELSAALFADSFE